MKFIVSFASMSATSPETASRPTTLLKKLLESLFLAVCPLMQVLNGSELLSLFTILTGYLGLTIYWSLNRVGETEIAKNFGLWKLDIDLFWRKKRPLAWHCPFPS